MDIINIIEIFYNQNVLYISKFELYRLMKNYNPYLSYYKLHKLFKKLLETKILVKGIKPNEYIFNKIQILPKPPYIIKFD